MKKPTKPKWNEHLQSLVQLEAENVAEEYRPGRAMNDVDEEMNAEIRESFKELQDKMPVLLAAPALLQELKHMVSIWEEAIAYEESYMPMADAAREAIAQAEGKVE